MSRVENLAEMSLEELKKELFLHPHPEGGYFREYVRSEKESLPGAPGYTVAYYVLEKGSFSAFHRLQGRSEYWLHHAGADLMHYHFAPEEKELQRNQLGPESQRFSLNVPADSWMASETLGDWSLVSCVVCPPFEFDAFELAKEEELLKSYPEHAELISRLCR